VSEESIVTTRPPRANKVGAGGDGMFFGSIDLD